MYKALNNILWSPYGEFFIRKGSRLNLRSQPDFFIPSVTKVRQGKSSLRYYGILIWNILPFDLRNAESIVMLKRYKKTETK